MKSQKGEILVVLDNEGVLTLGDNAAELIAALARACGLGEKVGMDFFQRMSVIDDIWGDFKKLLAIDPSYSSGHTLKVILPFFKAMLEATGDTSEWLYNFSRDNIRVVPNTKKVLKELDRKYNVWQVSTSYHFYIQAFCDLVGFDFNRSYCTKVEGFDRVPIKEREAKVLRGFMRQVAGMDVIKYDEQTGEVEEDHKQNYEFITRFIWETMLTGMKVGRFLRTVHPVGQLQKRQAVEGICQKNGVPKEKVFYVGDSQTDVQAVQESEISMMFNGKGPVCSLANLMYIGKNAEAIQEVADRFAELGREGIIHYYTPSRQAEGGGMIAAVTPDNVVDLEKKSVRKRKEIRGVQIGGLT